MNLSYALRPKTLSEFIGQEHLVGKDQLLFRLFQSQNLISLIFWGPPGSGKTTLANLIAKQFKADFYSLSAVASGKKDLQLIIAKARQNQIQGRQTLLFIDEIHRWNKAQQDTLLPYVESGLIVLIGATTENPSFEIISPLLSRSKLLIFNKLTDQNLKTIIKRAITNKSLGIAKYGKSLDKSAMDLLIRLSGGDARIALNALEIAIYSYRDKIITAEIIKNIFQTKSAGLYDKDADQHYHTISAFIKSMRGSDVDASLYYLARMLESGEDPKFIARRMIIFASEDIGLADRGALIQANVAFEAVTKIGLPEAKLILAHIVIYLALAKKSRSVANALSKAIKAVYDYPNEPVPLHLRNPSTLLNKNLGYGQNYAWSEQFVGPTKALSFLPDKLKKQRFYSSIKEG